MLSACPAGGPGSALLLRQQCPGAMPGGTPGAQVGVEGAVLQPRPEGFVQRAPGVGGARAPSKERSFPSFSLGRVSSGPAAWGWPCWVHLGETRSQKCL